MDAIEYKKVLVNNKVIKSESSAMSSLTLTTFLLAAVEDRCQCVRDPGDNDQHGDLQIRCGGCPAGETHRKSKSIINKPKPHFIIVHS